MRTSSLLLLLLLLLLLSSSVLLLFMICGGLFGSNLGSAVTSTASSAPATRVTCQTTTTSGSGVTGTHARGGTCFLPPTCVRWATWCRRRRRRYQRCWAVTSVPATATTHTATTCSTRSKTKRRLRGKAAGSPVDNGACHRACAALCATGDLHYRSRLPSVRKGGGLFPLWRVCACAWCVRCVCL